MKSPIEIINSVFGKSTHSEVKGIDANTKSVTAVGESIQRGLDSATMSVSEADATWAHIAVAKVASVTASSGWSVYKLDKDGERVEVYNEIIESILESPSPNITLSDFIYKLVGQREFASQVPVYIHTNGKAVEVLVLDSTKLTTTVGANTTYTYTWPNGSVQTISTNELKMFKVPDFFAGGSSTALKIKDWLLTERNFNQLQQDMAEFRSFVGGTLETNLTDQKAIDRWTDILRKRTEKRGADLVMPKGIKYNRETLSLRDMEMSKNDEQNGAKILKAFGVPKELLGDVDTSGRANVDGAYYGFVKYRIEPLLIELREFLNTQVLKDLIGDSGHFVDFDSVVPDDREQILEERKVALGGKAWLTPNEVRAQDGLDDMEGGDNLATPPAPVKASYVPRHVKMSGLRAKAVAKRKEEAEAKVDKSFDWDKIETALIEYNHKGFEARTLQKTKDLLALILKQNEQVEAEVMANLGKATSKAVEDAVVLSVEDNAEELYIASKDILLAIAVDEGANAVSLVSNPAGNYNAESKTLLKEIKRIFMLRAMSANKTTIKLLTSEIKEGIKAGESKKKLGKRVRGVFKGMTDYRSEALAQDVTFTSSNASMKSAYKQVGISEMRWYTAEDDSVCPYCKSQHARKVATDADFFAKGDKLEVVNEKGKKQTLKFDFDSVGAPALHSNCRCYVLPV
ncbi:MAG: phage portal protein [Gammaproteobacteria bacterium]|nr:phage portal protein [Gammaproteobacteria bacterium]